MNSIESQFVPYEQAVKLKGLGFDWECIYCWGKVVSHDKAQYMLTSHKRDDRTDAALFSQAFDWFRVEHGMSFHVDRIHAETNLYHYHVNYGWEYFQGDYESARLACLEKLIELVTEKQHGV